MSQIEAMGRLSAAMRRMGTASALHGQAIAARAGLSPVDLECLDMIHLEGLVTAGQIAQHAKLTTGAVTGLIDRLEKKGYVERVADPNDRRKVLVRIVAKNIKPVQNLYVPMSRSTSALMKKYTADELGAFSEFVEKAAELLMTRVRQLDRKSTSE